MLLQHYVELFDTSIADGIAQPTGFSQQAYATVKQKHPGYPPCGMTEVLFCLCAHVNQINAKQKAALRRLITAVGFEPTSPPSRALPVLCYFPSLKFYIPAI